MKGPLRAANLFGLVLAAASLATAGDVRSDRGLADFKQRPFEYFIDQRADEARRFAVVALADPAQPLDVRHRVLVTVGAIAIAEKKPAEARQALLRILADDPRGRLPYADEQLPIAVRRLYYALQDSVCTAQKIFPEPDIRTVAVGDIQVNVLDAEQRPPFDPESLAAGLVHEMVRELLASSSLRVVDRQRLAVLREEIRLGTEQGAGAAARVEAGRLVGAQSYLFGSLNVVAKDRVRLLLRWVDTSTSLVLIDEAIEGRVHSSKDVIALEDQIVARVVVPLIEKRIENPEEARGAAEKARAEVELRSAAVRGGKQLDFVLRQGDASRAEERGDYRAAATAWEAAKALAPNDEDATSRAGAAKALSGT